MRNFHPIRLSRDAFNASRHFKLKFRRFHESSLAHNWIPPVWKAENYSNLIKIGKAFRLRNFRHRATLNRVTNTISRPAHARKHPHRIFLCFSRTTFSVSFHAGVWCATINISVRVEREKITHIIYHHQSALRVITKVPRNALNQLIKSWICCELTFVAPLSRVVWVVERRKLSVSL